MSIEGLGGVSRSRSLPESSGGFRVEAGSSSAKMGRVVVPIARDSFRQPLCEENKGSVNELPYAVYPAVLKELLLKQGELGGLQPVSKDWINSALFEACQVLKRVKDCGADFSNFGDFIYFNSEPSVGPPDMRRAVQGLSALNFIQSKLNRFFTATARRFEPVSVLLDCSAVVLITFGCGSSRNNKVISRLICVMLAYHSCRSHGHFLLRRGLNMPIEMCKFMLEPIVDRHAEKLKVRLVKFIDTCDLNSFSWYEKIVIIRAIKNWLFSSKMQGMARWLEVLYALSRN